MSFGSGERLLERSSRDGTLTDAGSLTTELGHWLAVDQVVARGHLGHHEPGPEFRNLTSKGCIRNARHRRQKNPVRDLNTTYYQWVRTQRVEAAHGFLVCFTGAVTRWNPFLRTNLVQSSFMPTL